MIVTFLEPIVIDDVSVLFDRLNCYNYLLLYNWQLVQPNNSKDLTYFGIVHQVIIIITDYYIIIIILPQEHPTTPNARERAASAAEARAAADAPATDAGQVRDINCGQEKYI